MNMQTIIGYMNIGGTYVLYALLLCSVFVVYVCIDRLFYLYVSSTNGEWFLKQIANFLANNHLNDALSFCEAEKKKLIAGIFQIGLYRSHCNREDIMDAMTVGISDAARSLDSNLSILGTVAVIAPFVGLFGTVLGIIQAFNKISKHGRTGIATVGAGVAEALVTTAAGLLVAILSVMLFNYFKSRIKRMVGELTDYASRFGELLYFVQTGVQLPADIRVDGAASDKQEKIAAGTK
jgi:biopolymer transport protein ExbB